LIEHLTQNQVEGFCRQKLPRAELLSVSDHMEDCEACRRLIESATNVDAAFLALRAEVFGDTSELASSKPGRTHPTAEQTAGYLDGTLAGEELQMLVDHLTSCEQCVLAIDDLNAFRDQIAPSLEHEYHPTPAKSPTEGWWRRTVVVLASLFRPSVGLAFGAAVTVLLVAVTGWLIWRSLREREPKQENVASSTQSQPAPAPPVAEVVARLNEGEHQLTLDKEGTLSGADDLPPAYKNMLKDALTNPRIESSPQLKGLARSASSLMSTDKQRSEFLLLEPVGKVLLTDRPTFRWSQMDGATSYVVEVYDADFNLVAASPQLTTQLWPVPQSLRGGKIYSWQVKAVKDGQEITSPRPPAPQARFRILDRAKATELEKAMRTHASSHLVLGLLYSQAGLLTEAEQQLRLLQKANPDSEIARSLLSQVQALRRKSG
jgi:predicted anti-sigma-YlaC factor YlaD